MLTNFFFISGDMRETIETVKSTDLMSECSMRMGLYQFSFLHASIIVGNPDPMFSPIPIMRSIV